MRKLLMVLIALHLVPAHSFRGVANWAHANCGGVKVGGYCWYAGASSQDCDDVCISHGGCNLIGTKNYAGSGGSDTNCENVLDALGLGTGTPDNFNLGGVGCSLAFGLRGRDSDTTTCAATMAATGRACACNQ